MSGRLATITLRPDLIQKQIWAGKKQIWVIKDPLARSYSYFDQSEFAMLRLAAGGQTMDQLISECKQLLKPDLVSTDAIVKFFRSAHTAGIVLVDGKSFRGGRSGRRKWWHNPLAIRLPGINPDSLLDRIVPTVKPLVSPWSIASAVVLMIIAAMISVTHFPALAGDLGDASARLMSGHGLVWLMLIISVTKIVHELAHAVTCKFFGGDVLEMGVMLFVGTPCLYCDVSDAWLMEQRWKRIFISAAGILAELTIASLASIAWLITSDGLIEDLAVIVMVVCSVSTVLFNGNPLLRYDGYFILSDLVGVPNLAAESSAQLRSWLRQLVWGESAESSRPLLGLYAISSAVYRIGLYWLIAWLLLDIAKGHNVDGPLMALLLFAAGTIAWKWLRTVLSARPSQTDTKSNRPLIVTATLVGTFALAAIVPLPQRVTAPMSIEPANSQLVFVTRPGKILETVAPGAQVDAGTVIARITNAELERELASGRSESDRLRVKLETLLSSRTSNEPASADIEAAKRALDAANKRLVVLQQNADELELKAPVDGQVFLARQRESGIANSDQCDFWTGSPLDGSNRGAWLETGTVVCQIGDATDREAIVLLSQQQIDLIGLGQSVQIRLADRHHGSVTGQVKEVSTSPAQQIADELLIAGNVRQDEAPRYLVRVSIDRGSIPIRTIGQAKIHVEPVSIGTRVIRFLADSIR